MIHIFSVEEHSHLHSYKVQPIVDWWFGQVVFSKDMMPSPFIEHLGISEGGGVHQAFEGSTRLQVKSTKVIIGMIDIIYIYI